MQSANARLCGLGDSVTIGAYRLPTICFLPNGVVATDTHWDLPRRLLWRPLLPQSPSTRCPHPSPGHSWNTTPFSMRLVILMMLMAETFAMAVYVLVGCSVLPASKPRGDS